MAKAHARNAKKLCTDMSNDLAKVYGRQSNGAQGQIRIVLRNIEIILEALQDDEFDRMEFQYNRKERLDLTG